MASHFIIWDAEAKVCFLNGYNENNMAPHVSNTQQSLAQREFSHGSPSSSILSCLSIIGGLFLLLKSQVPIHGMKFWQNIGKKKHSQIAFTLNILPFFPSDLSFMHIEFYLMDIVKYIIHVFSCDFHVPFYDKYFPIVLWYLVHGCKGHV